jgi:hypothetical protein
MRGLVCEICEKASATEDDVWRLCPTCSRLYVHFLEWVKEHPKMEASDLEALKNTLRTWGKRAKEAEIVARK